MDNERGEKRAGLGGVFFLCVRLFILEVEEELRGIVGGDGDRK